MILSFELSMPSVNSWNGKWSGEGTLYAIVANFGRTKKGEKAAQKILDQKHFHYSFGDGWTAGITVKVVDTKTAAKIRRKSKGFCGYDWMVDSIKQDLRIISPSERKEEVNHD